MKKIIATLIILLLTSFLTFSDTYTLQLGVFSNEENAKKLADNFDSLGYETFTEKINSYNYLFLDKHMPFDEAKYLKEKIESIGYDSIIKKRTLVEVEDAEIYGSINSKNISLSNDICIQGVYGTYSIYFEVDEFWNLGENNYFELIHSNSKILEDSNSNIVVELNGIPLKTIYLDNSEEKSVDKIHLNPDLLNEGFNQINLIIYHRFSDNICEDELNPGNWINFFKDSYIHFEYTYKSDIDSLKKFPYPFIKLNESKPIDCEIVLTSLNKKNIEALSVFSTYIGQQTKYKNVELVVKTIDDYSDDKNHIFIGEYNELLEIGNENYLGGENTILSKVINEDHSDLYILSDNEEYLQNSIKALFNETEQLIFNHISVDENYNKPKFIRDKYISFEEMGFSDMMLSKYVKNQVAFGLDIPNDWIISEESYISLKLKHSALAQRENSSLNIYINGCPVKSILLYEYDKEGYTINVKIPKEVIKDNFLSIELKYDFDYYYDCESISFNESLWSYISNDSFIYIPFDIDEEIMFENYSSPLLNDGRLENIDIYLPDKITIEILNTVSNIFAYIGHDAEYIDSVNYLNNNDISDNNFIIIGRPEDIGIIEKYNSSLNIKYDFNKKMFLSNESINILDSFKDDVASIQLLKDFAGRSNSGLILTGTDYKIIYSAARYLSDYEFNKKLSGDTVLIKESGEFIKVKIAEENISNDEDQNVMDVETTTENKEVSFEDTRKFVIFLFAAFVILGIIGFLYKSVNRNNNKK